MGADQSVIKQVDFSKYRTRELFETISEMLSLPAKFWLTLFTTFGCSLALFLLTRWYFQGGTPALLLIGLEAYAIVAGMVAGFALGVAESIRRSLAGMIRILDLLLETTAHVASDIRQVRSGEQRMPTAAELVDVVYQQVFIPTVTAVISGSLGIFARPVSWFYRSTLGRLESLVVRDYLPETGTDKLEQATGTLPKKVDAAADSFVAQEKAILRRFDAARQRVVAIGGWIKLLVMMPCYLVFIVIVVVTLAPMIGVAVLMALDVIGSGEVAVNLLRGAIQDVTAWRV